LRTASNAGLGVLDKGGSYRLIAQQLRRALATPD
jgi:hypothetical protein